MPTYRVELLNGRKDEPVLVKADHVRTVGGFVRFLNRRDDLAVDEELVRMFKAVRVLDVELVDPAEGE